jgi:hypothetical protein
VIITEADVAHSRLAIEHCFDWIVDGAEQQPVGLCTQQVQFVQRRGLDSVDYAIGLRVRVYRHDALLPVVWVQPHHLGNELLVLVGGANSGSDFLGLAFVSCPVVSLLLRRVLISSVASVLAIAGI